MVTGLYILRRHIGSQGATHRDARGATHRDARGATHRDARLYILRNHIKEFYNLMNLLNFVEGEAPHRCMKKYHTSLL